MERITVNSKILGGKPVIKGTRISVEHILNLLASGLSVNEILDDYKHISKEDIQACLDFAAHSIKNDIYYNFEMA